MHQHSTQFEGKKGLTIDTFDIGISDANAWQKTKDNTQKGRITTPQFSTQNKTYA